MQVLERDLEKQCVAWARKEGFLVLKLTPAGQRGYPDRVFLQRERICFVEFKREGEKVTPIQMRRMERLLDLGYRVFVIRDFRTFKRQICRA